LSGDHKLKYAAGTVVGTCGSYTGCLGDTGRDLLASEASMNTIDWNPGSPADNGSGSAELAVADHLDRDERTKITTAGVPDSHERMPVNILIVDDDPKNLSVVQAILDDPGYRLVRTESAEQALLALLDEEFALLILDVRMPDVTGFELARMIRTRKKTANLPIIFLTAYYHEHQHIIQGYSAGAVDYLNKPVNPAILRSKVEVFADLSRKQRNLKETNLALTAEVTLRRRAEEELLELNHTLELRVAERTAALHKTTQRLRAIYDGTFEYVWLLAPDGSLLEANRSALEFAGCDLASLVGKPFWFLPWFEFTSSGETVRRAIARAARGERLRFELQINNRAGEARTLDIAFRPLHDDEGRVILIVPAGIDITARVSAERTARHLAAVVESSDDAIVSKDLDGNITTFNRGAERLFGYKAHEVIGKPVTILLPPDRQYEEPEILARIRRGEQVPQHETVRRRKDGTLVDVSVTVSPVKDDKGRVIGASKIARDITERTLSEARLRDSERRLQELITAIPAAIYTTDAEGRITYFNEAAVELAGRTPTIGSDEWCVTWKLYRPDGTPLPHDECPMAIALKEGRLIRNAEAVAERPDGTRVPFIPYPTPLRDSTGKIVGAINMLVDVSERKQAETQQRVLLNELNNRVKNNMQMLQSLLEVTARRTENAEARRVLEEASGRINAMAAAQRVLYGTPDATRFDARDFLRTVCETAKQTFPQQFDIDCEADAVRLSNEVAMPLALIANELLTNAVKYGLNGQGGGTVRVRLTRENDLFLFYVEDDGPGFHLKSVQRRASGLGLVQGFVRQLRGDFEVTRTPATRCTVRFQLG
jgi:PAS domain S-box-containing protein